MLIVDSHAHLISDAGVPALDASLEATLKHLDYIGCDYIVQVFELAAQTYYSKTALNYLFL